MTTKARKARLLRQNFLAAAEFTCLSLAYMPDAEISQKIFRFLDDRPILIDGYDGGSRLDAIANEFFEITNSSNVA